MDSKLLQILSLDEKLSVEFKTGKDKIPSSLFETYSAFANTSGGIIYLGIKENEKAPHNFEGVNNAKQKRKQLFDMFNNKEKMSSCLVEDEDIEILSFDEGDLIKICVREANRANKPVFINGDISNSFGRRDSGDYRLSEEKIQSFINDKNDVRFDQKPNSFKIQISDLDQESLDLFIQIIKETEKLPSAKTLDAESILQRVGGYARDPESGKYVLNNGAILLLGKTTDVNSICPNLWLDYTYVTAIDEKWGKRITNKDLAFEGNIFQFYIRSLNEILSNSPSPHYLDGVQDVGKKKVSFMIREAFANAISNLDLFDQYGLKITQTSNDIVFNNAGTMIVPLEEALLGGISKPRNPALFSYFLAMGISDHGGYGIPTLFDNSKTLGFMPPSLIEDKANNRTRLRINFRRCVKELTKEEENVVKIIASSKDGITIQEIVEKVPLGRDKTRKIVEALFDLGIVKTNNKVTKGKKYFIS